MLKVQLDDGLTLHFDLTDHADGVRWTKLSRDPNFQTHIRVLMVHHNGVTYSLPKPRGYGQDVRMYGLLIDPNPSRKIKGGEKIYAQAGENQVSLVVHKEQRAVRVDVTRVGKLKFNPMERGN